MDTMSKDFDIQTIKVVGATCCAIGGIFWECPAAFGCGFNSELTCLAVDCCCKCCGGPSMYNCTAPEGRMCQLGCCCLALSLKKPTSCCKGSSQCCCLLNVGAIPCDADVPFAIACLGLTCYPVTGCCLSLSEIPNPKKVAPA
jgi:hypothetical protein